MMYSVINHNACCRTSRADYGCSYTQNQAKTKHAAIFQCTVFTTSSCLGRNVHVGPLTTPQNATQCRHKVPMVSGAVNYFYFLSTLDYFGITPFEDKDFLSGKL